MGRSIDLEALYAGLVFSLPMYEGTGAATVKDVSKAHHPVTQVHSPAWTQLPSGIWCMDFTAAHPDYLTCAGASSTDLDFTTQNFTVTVWACLNAGFSACCPMSRNNALAAGWFMYVSSASNQLQFYTCNVTARATMGTANSIVAAKWQLLSFTRSGSAGRVYVDGIDDTPTAGGTVDLATCANAWRLGTDNEALYKVNGKLALPRIWNRALAPAEHMEIFNRERDLFHV